jgi:hypothetical protein
MHSSNRFGLDEKHMWTIRCSHEYKKSRGKRQFPIYTSRKKRTPWESSKATAEEPQQLSLAELCVTEVGCELCIYRWCKTFIVIQVVMESVLKIVSHPE